MVSGGGWSGGNTTAEFEGLFISYGRSMTEVCSKRSKRPRASEDPREPLQWFWGPCHTRDQERYVSKNSSERQNVPSPIPHWLQNLGAHICGGR